jgi:hypothetical protein
MYRGSGILGVGVGGGSLAATGVPIAMTLILAFAVVVAGLLMLRWGKVRRGA